MAVNHFEERSCGRVSEVGDLQSYLDKCTLWRSAAPSSFSPVELRY